MNRPTIIALCFAGVVAVCLLGLPSAHSQSGLRRVTNTTDEGININPSLSGDGRIAAFESTEDVAGAGGVDHFRAIRANVSVDPASFFQMAGSRDVAPGISQDGSRITFASKDNPLGANPDGNSEIFLFDGSLHQVTSTSPGDISNRVTNGNFQPSISDDGRFIAFSSNRDLASQNSDGNLEIFVYDSVASSFAQLTNTAGAVGCSDAKISGNGASVAYIRDAGTTASAKRDLLEQPRVGGAAVVLAANVQSLAMTYGRAISDDGSRVVFSGETATDSSQVFLYDGRGGSTLRQLTTLGTRVTEVPLHPTISGDGTRIAFATRRPISGLVNSDSSIELYTYDTAIGQFARVTSAPAEADGFDGTLRVTEVVSSLNDDGSIVAFNFPRALSGPVASGFENKSEIYVTATAVRPPFGALTAILNGASFGHEPSPTKAIAPDSIAVARGTNLANSTMQSQRLPNGSFPTNVAGTSVTVNGRPAQIFFISPTQVNFLVPPQTELGTAEVIVTNGDNFPSRGNAPTLRAAPGIFTKSGDGIGEGMILNADTLQEGPFDPSSGNLRLSIFTTGARNAIQTQVTIGGRVINAESVIASPNMPGLDEIHVRVPADLRGAGIVNLSVQSDGRDSNPVTVAFTGDPSRAVFINEVLADPPDGIAGDANHDGTRDGTQDEFVELVNGTTTDTIGLSGWTIRTRATGGTTESTRFTFAQGTTLRAGEAIVVFGGGSFDPSDGVFGCAQVVKSSLAAGLSLTNGGLTILIRDGAGNLITQFAYGGSTGLDGDNNQSLTRSPDITGSFVQHTSAAGANGRRYSPGLRVDGTPFGSCPRRLTSITISPGSTSGVVGETKQFTAQAFDQFGQAMTGVTISFVSDNTTVATVDSVSMNSSTGAATANVTGHNPGVAHITASATDGSTIVNSTQSTLTVNGPSLSINDVSLNEGNSGLTTFTFTVSLSTPAPVGGVSFDIATQDNTATVANGDYVARSLTAQTIPAGQSSYTFDVSVMGDLNIEPNETFFVNVTNVTGASVGDGQGLGTIVTDDSPALSINDVSANEGNSGPKIFTFTVSSSLPAPAGGITFDIATADGTATAVSGDYVSRSLTGQTIPAGQQTYTFDVTVNGDTLVEANETFFVNISNVSANAAVADSQGQGTIQNDDTVSLVISQVYGGGNNSGAPFRNDFVEIYNRGNATVDFTVTPYSIQYAAVGSNFGGTTSSSKTNLTTGVIAPGRYFLVQEDGGTTNGVALPTPNVTGSIAMGNTAGKIALVAGTTALTPAVACPGDDGSSPFNPANAAIADFVGYGNTATTSGHCYEGAAPAAAPSNTTADFRKAGGCVDTNENGADFFAASPSPRNSASPAGNCQPEITINDVTVTEGNGGTVNATFTVSLSAASAQTVTVNYATADGTAVAPDDYQTTSGLLTFNPGDLTKSITVLVNGDTLDEANETFFVNLSGATNAVLLDSQGQGTITDNDAAPSLSINDLSIAEGDSSTTQFTFTVSLSTASGQTVTVNYATADGTAASPTDYQSNSGLLTFNPGDTAKLVTVLVNGDTTFEQNETFFVNLTTPTNATISDSQGQGTITNDDAAPATPTFFITDKSALEGDSGTTSFVFDVSLSPASAQIVQVDFATVNGTATLAGNDYQQNSGTLIFNPGDGPKQITVLVNGDRLVEPNETFTVHLSNATNGAGIGTPDGLGTIQNDDTADLVISQTYPGGGLTGASFTNDYIELFNQGSTTVDFAVTPYSVQFLSTSASAWAKTDLTSGTLAPGRYFLVKETSGGAVGAALPTADATGTLNLTSTTAGKVALVVGTTLLVGDCPGDNGAPPFNPVDGTVVDFVGYGGTAATASHCYEGSGPASYTLSNNTTADFRKFGGCQDTNDNTADFDVATPSPRNTSSPVNDCTSADLGITKTDSPDPVITGSNVTYTIVVTNNGPATATSVVVTDNLPANVTFVSCASTGSGVCGGTGNNRTITFATLAAAASETITLVATANGPAGTPITNTTTVSSSTTDPVPGNNTATATTAVNNPSFADLSIVKSDSPDPVFPTTTLTYTLSVTNNGPDTAQSLVVTDALPSAVTFVDCASNQGGVCGGTSTSPTVTFSSLANGVTATITIHVTVNSNVTGGTVISNTASVTSSTTDSTPGNNSDSEDTTVQELNAGDVLISEFRTRGPAGTSDEFIELYNPTSASVFIGGMKVIGSNSSAGTAVRATITAGTTLGSGCHYLLATSSYSGSVAADQTYGTTIADDGGIAFTRADGTTIIDQVGMSSGSAYKEGTTLTPLSASVEQSYERKPGGAFGNGTDTNNNSADFFLNASSSNPQNSSTGCINTSAADVSITKTDSPDPVISGSNVTYTIVVTNNGPGLAQSVVVTDNLPGTVSFVSCASTGSGVCGGAANNRTISFASLASGASQTITLVATANGVGGTTITNTATVSSATTDPTPGNNSATATTDVSNPISADLSITKSDSPDPVQPGATLTYTLSVTNSGPDAAPSVLVTDNLSADVTFVDCASNQSGVCGGTGNNRTISFSSLANGATATITIHVTVSSALTTGAVIANTASVTSSATDSVPGNNSDSENTTVQEVSAGQLVISEFRTRGPAGTSDEFIELYNPTSASVFIGGLKVIGSNGTGGTAVRATITAGTTLGSGCHYLLAFHTASCTNCYLGAVTADQTYSTSITDDGGIAITRADGTTIIDQVGMSAGSAYKEGTTLTPLSASVEQSYERKPGGAFGNGTDTDNNANDFFLNASSSNPQNSSTGCIDTTAADVSITKTDSPDPVAANSNIAYTINVTNNGPATANNLAMSDTVPANTTFVSLASPGTWSCTTPSVGGTGAINCTTSSLALQTATFTLTVKVNAGVTGGTVISNTATVSSSTTDPNSANNSVTQDTSVQPSADLSITKADSADPVPSGAQFNYTIMATNNSVDAALTVTVTDNLPADVTFVSCASTGVGVCGGTGNNRTVTFTSIAGGATETVTLVVRANHSAAGTTISNTATVGATGTADPNGANNSATQTTGVSLPPLVISYIYGGGGANTGSPSYTRDFVEIFNKGAVSITLSGLSLQQGATTGNISSTYTLCPGGVATCTLSPGQYYLVETGTAGTAGAALSATVTPDDTGGTPTFAATNGKGALVTGTSALGCGATATPCGAAPLARIVDLVGYGSGTTQAEGNSPTGNLSTTTAARRKASGCTDTNVNLADFDIVTPTGGNAPRHMATLPLNVCPP